MNEAQFSKVTVTFSILPEQFAICRLEAKASIPSWADRGSLTAIIRTPDELTIVCRQVDVPVGIPHEPDWCCLQVVGPLDFSLTGILASLTLPLAQAGIPVFALSTYDTDYLLIKVSDRQRAITVLIQAGHRIAPQSSSAI